MNDLGREVQVLKRRVEEIWALLVRQRQIQPAKEAKPWYWVTDVFDTGSTGLPSAVPTDTEFGAASSLTKGSVPGERLSLVTWVACPGSGNVVGYRARMRIRNGGESLRVPFELSSSASSGTTGRFGLRVNGVLQEDGYVALPQGVSWIGVYGYFKTAPGYTVGLSVELPDYYILSWEEPSGA